MLREIRRAVHVELTEGRQEVPDYILCGAAARDALTDATVFTNQLNQSGTRMTPDSMTIEGLPVIGLPPLASDFGRGRYLVGKRLALKFALPRPWQAMGRGPARDPATQRFTARTDAYGAGWFAVYMPALHRRAHYSVIAYRASERLAQ